MEALCMMYRRQVGDLISLQLAGHFADDLVDVMLCAGQSFRGVRSDLPKQD